MSLLFLIGSSRIPSLLILCFLNINPSSGLQKGEENVCSKFRSVKVLDVYPSNWTENWDCQSYFPEISCDRIRSGEVDIESVYFVLEEFTCCPGWTMPDDVKHCNKSCESGVFGENCQFPCRCFNSPDRTTCQATDGSCDCSPGWTGRECDQRCNPGTFGAGCSERSLFTCQNGGSNDPVTGACLCPSRYIGPACEFETDEVNPVECERCPQSCDTTGERCRCNDGFRGRYCSDMCEVGTRSLFCGEECCSGNGHCPGEAESCLCQDGYRGKQCQSQCENGNYGRNCQKECICESCNHITGVCTTCPFGFKGDTCTMICSSSEWGESCNNTCQCANKQPCDVFSGKCPQSGFTGALVSIIAVIFIAGLLILICVTLRCILKRRNTKVQNENNHNVVEHDDHFTLGARIESSDWTEDCAYTIPQTQHSQNTKLSNPLYGSAPAQMHNEQIVEHDDHFTLGARIESSDWTEDCAYTIPQTQHSQNTKLSNPLYGSAPAQMHNEQIVEHDDHFTLGARIESSDWTEDCAYTIPQTQHSQNTKLSNPLYGSAPAQMPTGDGPYTTLGDRDEPHEYSNIYLTPTFDRLSSVLTENDAYAPIESIIAK